MAEVTAEEMGEEMAEVTVYIADTVASAEYTPGHQRSDPAEENTSGRKPLLYQWLKV